MFEMIRANHGKQLFLLVRDGQQAASQYEQFHQFSPNRNDHPRFILGSFLIVTSVLKRKQACAVVFPHTIRVGGLVCGQPRHGGAAQPEHLHETCVRVARKRNTFTAPRFWGL